MAKKIVVTGLAGFIGFHTALALKKRGDEVVGFDNFDPYYPLELKLARVKQLKEVGIECETGDLTDRKFLNHFFNKHQPTGVIHLAAQAGVRYSIEKPYGFIDSNIMGFVNLLELIKETPEVPFIYASSSSVYGDNEKIPFAEADNTDFPASLYGATKKCNEVIGASYHHLYKIKMAGLRFFTVYGPWGRPDMAYWLFADAIFNEKPIKVFNEGNLERDFTYIDDIVAGIIASLDLAPDYEIYNLGNSHSHTLMEFIEEVEKAAGKNAQKEMLPMQAGDVHKTHADTEKSHKDLDFSPKTPLNVGMPKFMQWYKTYHNIA